MASLVVDASVARACGDAAQEIVKLQQLLWVNPSKPEETPIEWLQNGTPADPERMLGYSG
jgi:hypothetical protein